MPIFAPPSITTSEETISLRSFSHHSGHSFHTAEELDENSERMDSNIRRNEDDSMMIEEKDHPVLTNDTKALIKIFEEQQAKHHQDMEQMRANMAQLMTIVSSVAAKQQNIVDPENLEIPINPVPQPIANIKPMQFHQSRVVEGQAKELKWPNPYDHSDPSTWNTTYGLLKHIYRRDVEERKFLQPSDYSMQLFSHAVTGTARDMVTGYFENMMMEEKTYDALGLLKEMDNLYRDQNAEQTAALLLYSCKQFKDECLTSFLPRFQQMLTRSPSSASDDKSKSICLRNALNQMTKKYLIGRIQPETYNDLVKFLSIIGSQMTEIGSIRTKKYVTGQIGTFDDGTRGFTGGKLLAGNFTVPPSQTFNIKKDDIDADGDTRMTGMNKFRARWVSKKEIDRRKAEGDCIRCGKKGHRIANCHFLPAQHTETGIKVTSSVIEELTEMNDSTSHGNGALKD